MSPMVEEERIVYSWCQMVIGLMPRVTELRTMFVKRDWKLHYQVILQLNLFNLDRGLLDTQTVGFSDLFEIWGS